MSLSPRAIALVTLLALPGLASAASPALSDPTTWPDAHGVSRDDSKSGPDGSPAFRLAPGAKAALPLRDDDGAGKLTVFVYDDGAVASPDGKHGVGPRWGFTQADGRVFVGSIMYAPYLQPAGSYCVIDADPAAKSPWFNLTYLTARQAGSWKKWEFDYQPEAGLKISVDGKLARHFDWNRTKALGFNGIVLLGDATDKGKGQNLWVSGLSCELAGPMRVRPVPPPPPPPVVPERDPAPEGDVPQLTPAAKGKHPRLLVSAETLPACKAFFASDAAAKYRADLEAYLPACKPFADPAFLDDATDGQRQGFWKLPTVALHALLTADATSKADATEFLRKLVALPHWETGKETDSGMSAGNIMVGAALAYDWLYHDLEPAFRERARQKLIAQARAMYHGGHLMKNPGPHYWQGDPANNHRWHRNAGLALAVLAAYEGEADLGWLLQQTARELAFIHQWLPADGTSHESPGYLVFGANHLVLAMQASDDCLGTRFLQSPFFRNTGRFLAHTTMPGFAAAFGYGDWDGNGLGHYNNFRLKLAAIHRQPDLKDASLRLYEIDPSTMDHAWFSFLWDDPGLPRGDATSLPRASFWPDIGLGIVRDSWEPGARSAMFKCGPFGGYTLNRYRAERGGAYINVAHDDPDANAFVLAAGTEFLAETDRYAEHKASRSHNTILVNGLGQMAAGRPENVKFSQPGGDMARMGVVTAWRDTGKVVAVEGEAAGSYLAWKDKTTGAARPALDRFRRTFLWVKGDYVLVLDDIRAPIEVEIAWLMQGPNLEREKEGSFVLRSANHSCPFAVAADRPLAFTLRDSPAESRGKPLGFTQLRADAKTPSLRVASVYDLWNRNATTVRLDPVSDHEARVTVENGDLRDVWLWKSAPDRDTASSVRAERERGPKADFPFLLDPSNSAPPQDPE